MSLNKTLIAVVQKRQALYDKTDDNYSNRVFIANQWQEIGKEIGIDAHNTSTFVSAQSLEIRTAITGYLKRRKMKRESKDYESSTIITPLAHHGAQAIHNIPLLLSVLGPFRDLSTDIIKILMIKFNLRTGCSCDFQPNKEPNYFG